MQPLVGVLMGSKSDWNTMQHCCATLESLGIACEARVISAHRAPQALVDYAQSARSRGLEVIIAGAGGAAHLPGVTAALTDLPVLGIPMETTALGGLDSLLSIVQMPGGIPVATFAIGKAGAVNAAVFAATILAGKRPEVLAALQAFRDKQTQAVLDQPDPRAAT
jgi:5-(carboxyamino)imidazole ribonucleotide mutase